MKDAKYVLLFYIFFRVLEKKHVKSAARIAVESVFFLYLPPDFSYKIVYNWPIVSKKISRKLLL